MSAPAIVFDEERHAFTVDGRPVRSVSSILKAAGLGVDYSQVSPATLAYARERGTHVDLCCRLLDEGCLEWNSVVEEAKPYVEAWALFKQTTGFRPTQHQPRGYHAGLGYCGIPDVFGWLPYASGAYLHNAIVDLKATYDVSRSYGLQLGAYAMEGIQYPDRLLTYPSPLRVLVQLQKTGKYKLFTDDPDDDVGKKVFRPEDYETFKAACVIARWKETGR